MSAYAFFVAIRDGLDAFACIGVATKTGEKKAGKEKGKEGVERKEE